MLCLVDNVYDWTAPDQADVARCLVDPFGHMWLIGKILE